MSATADVLSSLEAIIAIVLSLGIAFWSIYWSFQRQKLHFEERRLLIEKGIQPPPLRGRWGWSSTPTQADLLRRGVVMLAMGVGQELAVVFRVHFMGGLIPEALMGLMAIGAPVIGCLGIGYLICYVLAKRSIASAGTANHEQRT